MTTILAGALLASDTAQACGGTFCDAQPFDPMPVDQFGEDILFKVADGQVEVHIRIAYEGAAERFAWVIPLQAIPEIEVGSEALFTVLRNVTVPRWTRHTTYDCQEDDPSWPPDPTGGDGDPGGDGDGDGGGPEIVLKEIVGAFEIVVLQGGTAVEVLDFLDMNGYEQDPEAEPILQEYLDEGFLFAAVKLTADADTDEIHPLVFRFAGDEPCVPIRLTRIAAKEDMDIRAYFVGDDRWAPSNYDHVIVNPLAFGWNSPSGAAYDQLLSAAIDEAGGHAFATEFAGPATFSTAGIYSQQWSSAAFIGLDPVGALIEVVNQGLAEHPLITAILLEYIPPPPNVDPFEFWNFIDLYLDQIDLMAWDDVAFAAALEERIIAPGENVVSLFAGNPMLTALHSLMDPSEMTVDPVFHAAPDLGNTGAIHQDTEVQVMCGDQLRLYHVEIGFDDYPVCVPTGESYPLFDEMPAALRIEQLPMAGPAQVLTDNLAVITELYEAHQNSGVCETDTGGTGTGTGGGTDAGESGPGLDDGGASSGCACSTREGQEGGEAPLGLALGLLGLGLLARRRHPRG